MDTVYGTKKYFQSLSGVSDIYRTQTCRQMVSRKKNLLSILIVTLIALGGIFRRSYRIQNHVLHTKPTYCVCS